MVSVFDSSPQAVLFWVIVVVFVLIFIAILIVILVIKPEISSSSSSSSSSSESSSSSSESSSSSSQSTSSASFPVGGCGDILFNLDTDFAFWLSKDNNAPSCVPTLRLTDPTRMVQYTLEGSGITTQDAYNSDLVLRTGGRIEPNPTLPAPVITVDPTERLRITDTGAVQFASNEIVVPNGLSSGFYFGNPSTTNSWRLVVDTSNSLFLFQAWNGSAYVTKSAISL